MLDMVEGNNNNHRLNSSPSNNSLMRSSLVNRTISFNSGLSKFVNSSSSSTSGSFNLGHNHNYGSFGPLFQQQQQQRTIEEETVPGSSGRICSEDEYDDNDVEEEIVDLTAKGLAMAGVIAGAVVMPPKPPPRSTSIYHLQRLQQQQQQVVSNKVGWLADHHHHPQHHNHHSSSHRHNDGHDDVDAYYGELMRTDVSYNSNCLEHSLPNCDIPPISSPPHHSSSKTSTNLFKNVIFRNKSTSKVKERPKSDITEQANSSVRKSKDMALDHGDQVDNGLPETTTNGLIDGKRKTNLARPMSMYGTGRLEDMELPLQTPISRYSAYELSVCRINCFCEHFDQSLFSIRSFLKVLAK